MSVVDVQKSFIAAHCQVHNLKKKGHSHEIMLWTTARRARGQAKPQEVRIPSRKILKRNFQQLGHGTDPFQPSAKMFGVAFIHSFIQQIFEDLLQRTL